MRLEVEEGYNRGATFILGHGPILVGRGEDCPVLLADESVSRRHAEIAREEGRWRVRDLDSRNGTRVNGVPVAAAEVAPGDRIAIGNVRLLVTGREPGATDLDRPTVEIATDGGDRPRPRPGPDLEEFLGRSPAVLELLDRLARAAPTTSTILVAGESGTGKELVARAVHRLSPRRHGPFVALNCAALPADLVESELFGHEAGAFTGATATRAGLAEASDRGTLFLDEVGEMALPTQAKLLRFLETGEIRRVGATEPIAVDVRLVAATHRDLAALVGEGSFREDLLYRLRVVELIVPPLRQRGEDILLLADAFLARLAGQRKRFGEPARQALAAYAWPGNVREMKNAIEAAVILSTGQTIELWDLPPRLGPGHRSDRDDRAPRPLSEVEREAILEALRYHDGHRTRTADALGIDRKTLYKKLKDLGIG